MTTNPDPHQRGLQRGLDPDDEPHIGFDELRALLARVFEAGGMSAHVARIIAGNCASAERDGSTSHGVFRVQGYLDSLASGWVDGHAVPVVSEAGAAWLDVDAANGFAQPALLAARERLVERARQHGVALLTIRRSHHFAALWPDVEPFADEGLVALSCVNSMASVVPYGGHTALLGTNPVAFAAPRDGHDPFVFDLATSSMSHGDVQLQARAGQMLPEGFGVDRNGQPTLDPAAVLDGGAITTFGLYKGAALSMMIELLAAALTGGNFSFETDSSAYPGAQTPCTGQMLLVIDPSKGGGRNLGARCETLCRRVLDAGQQSLPGERRFQHRRWSMQRGIGIDPGTLYLLNGLTESAG